MSTARPRYPQLELDHQLCFALARASRAVVRSYAAPLAELGLTYPQYLVMLVLWESPDQPVSVGEIGTRLHLDNGTLTPLLKRLEQAGVVTRRRDPLDERRVLVAPTELGDRLRDRAAGIPARVFAGYRMSLDDAGRLKTLLDQLADNVETVGSETGDGTR